MRRWLPAVILSLVAGCAEQADFDDACATCDDDAAVSVDDQPDAAVVDDRVDAASVMDVPVTDVPVTDIPREDVVDVPAAPRDVPGDLPADRGAPARDVVDVPGAQDVPRDAGARPDVPVTGGCVSGAAGRHVARFRWTGSGSGSRASVSYEANTLPDRSRWRVTAASRSIGYTPVWGDPFLGEGGLDLSGTAFMHVELSTAGLSSIRSVTLAIYGRSYSIGTSGSFSWMSFDGAGAAPSGSVANSAPYRWYRADATDAFRPGNGGVLLRISPGPPSGSLVVNRVELCFEAD